jgi:chloramphenicol-sensitive protein RarD
MSEVAPDKRGLAAGALAFTVWGVFPLYLYQLREVPAVQVIAHRISWSCVFVIGWLLWRGELGELRGIFARPLLLARLLLSALLISCNWLVYVWSVSHAHVVDTSLGYYINPLLNVVLGVLVLHERLNRWQWSAVALAAIAVAYLTVQAGHPPWIACALALSFSLYGLVRKVISVEALPGLATETLLLLPLVVAFLLWCAATGSGAFGTAGARVSALLIGSGLVTAVPLYLFAYAARRLPYSTVGVLQYIGPSLQLVIAVVVFHESFGSARALGFALIWIALAIYAFDGLRSARAAAPARRLPDADGAARSAVRP